MGSSRRHTIERIKISALDWGDPAYPRFANFRMRGLIVPAASLGGLAGLLGLSSLTVDLELEHRFDEAKKTVEVSRGDLKAAELGEARVRFAIADLTSFRC